jgi:hypothetical protein
VKSATRLSRPPAGALVALLVFAGMNLPRSTAGFRLQHQCGLSKNLQIKLILI